MNNSIYSKNPLLKRAEPALDRVFQPFLAAGRFLRRFLTTKKRQRKAVADCARYFCGQKVHKSRIARRSVVRPGKGEKQDKKTHNKQITDKL
ncbi:hypothetical protein [Alistipes sp.]|uniref:hypothetical protein n=1 Tax=Alistipes sp. TaxID=1872444 RepID=UPI00307E7736